MPGTGIGTNRENSRTKLSKLPDVEQPASSRPCHCAAAEIQRRIAPGAVGDGDDVSCRSCNILEDIGRHAYMPVLFSIYLLLL